MLSVVAAKDIKVAMIPDSEGKLVNPCTPAVNTNLLRYVKAQIVVDQHQNIGLNAQRVISMILEASPKGKTGWFGPKGRDQRMIDDGKPELAFHVSLLEHGSPQPAGNCLGVVLQSKFDIPDGKLFTEVMNDVKRNGYNPGKPTNTLFNHFSYEELECKAVLNGEKMGDNLFIPGMSTTQKAQIRDHVEIICKGMAIENDKRNCHVTRDKVATSARELAYFLERIADACEGNENAFTEEKKEKFGPAVTQFISFKGLSKSVRRTPDGKLFLVSDDVKSMIEMQPHCTKFADPARGNPY
eukprot:g933.t1